MKKFTFLIISVLLVSNAFQAFAQTQEDLNTFNKERLKIQKTGMGVLGAWAVGNIAVGVVGAETTSGSVQELHKMNIIWNGINLALAVPGYIGASKGKYDLPFRKTYKEQVGAEKTFLFNGGLDVAYILGGLYLVEKSKNATDLSKHNRYLGYGNSIMFQGAFLALLDITMYNIHKSHGKRKLDPYLDKIVIGYNGVGFRHTF
ncbi:MAG TPA: hypothetical protein VNB90_13730 [Cytophagaceae bacterium]|nr:hypothetical protein [Cytophagaceae bacterium]